VVQKGMPAMLSAGLTIVANAAIAAGPALFWAARCFVLNLVFTTCKGEY